MESDYTAFLHDTPAHNNLDDEDDQVDSVNGDDDPRDDEDDDEYTNVVVAEEEEEDADEDGYALKEATGSGARVDVAGTNGAQQPQSMPSGQFTYQSGEAIPYSVLAAAFIQPYFITPPQHNPYSPSGGAGHLHPPIFSQNPYPIPTPPSGGPTEVPVAVPGPSTATGQPTQDSTQYNPSDYINEEPSSPEAPPAKKRRGAKAPKQANDEPTERPIDELFIELPPPPPIEDPDPTAPPNSHPGRVLYPKYKCAMCESKFPRKNAVVAHIKTHLGKRRYVCAHPGCDMAFVREHDCRRHESTHSGSRPYVCVCGRPFARPDALRRHKERGHCGIIASAQEKDPPTGSDPLAALASASGVDPTWTEGRPAPVLDLASAVAAASTSTAPGVAGLTTERLLELTRQLQEANAAAQAGQPLDLSALHTSGLLSAGPDDVDGVSVAGPSTAVPSQVKRGGKASGANKSTKKTGNRKKVKKSSAVVHDDDDDDTPDQVVATQPGADSNGSQAIYAAALGTSPYGTSGSDPAHFLPFLQGLTAATASPEDSSTQSANSLAHVPFGASPNNASFSGFIPGQAAYPYNFGIPTGQSGRLPLAANNASRTSLYPTSTTTDGTSGAFSRAAPATTSSVPTAPAAGFTRTDANGGVAGPVTGSKSAGVSLVELAVDAATRAQQQAQRRQEAERQQMQQAQEEARNHARQSPVDGMELDVGMDLLEARETNVDGEDIDGTDFVADGLSEPPNGGPLRGGASLSPLKRKAVAKPKGTKGTSTASSTRANGPRTRATSKTSVPG